MTDKFGHEAPPPLPGDPTRVATNASKAHKYSPPNRPGWLRRWFWAPVKNEENWAQTILRVLGNLFRIVLTTVVVIVAVVVSIASYFGARGNYPEWFGSSYQNEWCDDQYDNEYYKHDRSEKVCSARWAELDAARDAELASRASGRLNESN